MGKFLCGVTILLFFLGIPEGFADMFSPSHSCYKPSKPYQFNSEWEISSFKSDVERYRNCIQDFVEEQNDAIRNHRNAAEEAVSDWESFVRYELN